MAILGYQLLSHIPIQSWIYIYILCIVFFLAMLTLAQEPGWNIVLMIGFSFTVGSMLKWSKTEVANWNNLLVFLAFLGAAVIGAIILRALLQRNLKVLHILSVLYFLGWLMIILQSLPGWILNTMVPIGLVLFTLLSAASLQKVISLDKEENPTPLAIELWLLFLNLFWLSSLIVDN